MSGYRTNRLVIEFFDDDPLTRVYHVNEELGQKPDSLERPARAELAFDLRSTPVNEQLIPLLFISAPGTLKLDVDIYKLRVTIAPAFDWEVIEKEVISHLQTRLSWYSGFEVQYLKNGEITDPPDMRPLAEQAADELEGEYTGPADA